MEHVKSGATYVGNTLANAGTQTVNFVDRYHSYIIAGGVGLGCVAEPELCFAIARFGAALDTAAATVDYERGKGSFENIFLTAGISFGGAYAGEFAPDVIAWLGRRDEAFLLEFGREFDIRYKVGYNATIFGVTATATLASGVSASSK